MSTILGFYTRWRRKRQFVQLSETLDQRLLSDVGFTPDVVHKKLHTPFWRYE